MKLLDIITKLADPYQIEALEAYVTERTPEFLQLWKKHPLKMHHTSYVSLSEAFWLWSFAKDLQPALAAESGTFYGYSAWWLHEAINGRLITFDIQQPLIHGLPRWEHRTTDFSSWQESPTMVFFDDHQPQPLRLFQASVLKCKHVLFHDVMLNSELWNVCSGQTVFQFPKLRTLPFNERELSGHRNLTYIGL